PFLKMHPINELDINFGTDKGPEQKESEERSASCEEGEEHHKEDCKEIVSIELDDTVCNVPKKNITNEIQNNFTNEKLKSTNTLRCFQLLLFSHIQIEDKDVEEELLDCADKYVVDKITGKVIEEKKRDIGKIGSRMINYGTSKGPEQKEYEERSSPSEEEKYQKNPEKQLEMIFFGVPDDQKERKEDILSAIQDAASPEQ
ncbi:16397_t:CDS:2, partial [Gigaspora rosea]